MPPALGNSKGLKRHTRTFIPIFGFHIQMKNFLKVIPVTDTANSQSIRVEEMVQEYCWHLYLLWDLSINVNSRYTPRVFECVFYFRLKKNLYQSISCCKKEGIDREAMFGKGGTEQLPQLLLPVSNGSSECPPEESPLLPE